MKGEYRSMRGEAARRAEEEEAAGLPPSMAKKHEAARSECVAVSAWPD